MSLFFSYGRSLSLFLSCDLRQRYHDGFSACFGAMRSQRLAHSTVILIYPINSCFVARALLLLEGQISRFSIVKWRVFEKSLQYVKHSSCYKNQDSIRQAREYPLII
ncbi:uncharacterized protein LOC114273340 [Camellia sinensis]|uniref:uncharacterized protein LOC114273340 n=1 Tax=Camellia sinensis TaxID=4442 RepID=UPI001035F2BB|nr:uncharacterized protein LOC114273340 [Camellia sinensis]